MYSLDTGCFTKQYENVRCIYDSESKNLLVKLVMKIIF